MLPSFKQLTVLYSYKWKPIHHWQPDVALHDLSAFILKKRQNKLFFTNVLLQETHYLSKTRKNK